MPSACDGRDELERHGLGKETSLGGERLRRDAELGQRVLGETRARRQSLRQPGEVRLEQLHRALARGRDHRREPDPQVVERRGQREDVEVGHRHDPILGGERQRVVLRRVQLDVDCPAGEGERVAQRPVHLRDAAERDGILEVAGAPPSRGSCPEERARNRSSSRPRPGYGRVSATRGWRIVRFAANASRSSARRRRARPPAASASARASAARLVENAPLFRSASPPCRGEPNVAEEPVGEVGHRGQVGLADRAERADGRHAIVVQRANEASASSGRTPGSPVAKELARRSIAPRTTSSENVGPWPSGG